MNRAVRRGLVLGGGGILGAAWQVGAMCALEAELGLSLVDTEAIVGTSAGSVVACFLAAGVSSSEQCAYQRGERSGRLAEVEFDYTFGGVRPRPPFPPLGSPRLVASWLLQRGRLGAPALLAGLLPRGRGSLGELATAVESILPDWPTRPALRIVATDFVTGRRQPFGPDQAGPEARAPRGEPVPGETPPGTAVPGKPPLGEALPPPAVAMAASCAMPSVFAPVAVDGRSFVDGGAASMASADLLAGLGLDEVYVLAPLANVARTSGPWSVGRFLLGQWRQPQTAGLLREIALLEEEGVKVTLLAPTAEDLAVFGLNPMDPARRLDVLETALRTTRSSLRATAHAD